MDPIIVTPISVIIVISIICILDLLVSGYIAYKLQRTKYEFSFCIFNLLKWTLYGILFYIM